MGIDHNFELEFANLELNELVQELSTFDDGDPLEVQFCTLVDANLGLNIKEHEV